MSRVPFPLWIVLSIVGLASILSCPARAADRETIRLRCGAGVPDYNTIGAANDADLRILDAFRAKYPWIDPVSTTGIVLAGGSNTMDMVPFMQIAGDIAPDAMYVNFRQSNTYIEMKLLYPLDAYIEELAGVKLADSSSLENDAYLAELKKGAGWGQLEHRVPRQCWQVMRRECPLGADCRYRKELGLASLAHHRHTWAFPIGPLVMGLQYDRSIFAEHADEGIEPRAPGDWEEMLKWATIVTDPEKHVYGLNIDASAPAWKLMNFLYSAGGEVVHQDPDGTWRCVMDSEEAVEAVWFAARMRWQPVVRNGTTYYGVLSTGDTSSLTKFTMDFTYLDDRFLAGAEDRTKGFAPVPKGYSGKRGSEFNSMMLGIFSGLADQPERRDAAWKYMLFYDGADARRIRTQVQVDAGLGQFVRPYLLEQFNEDGRYDSLIFQQKANPELEETYRVAYEGGVPEPYGKNCQYVYKQLEKPLGEILSTNNAAVRDAVKNNNPEAGKAAIREILKRATANINISMLGNLPPPVQKQRATVSWIVIAVVIVLFAWVLRKTFKAFRGPETVGNKGWQFSKYRVAYLLLAPALISIAIWAYWPLAKGSAVAFQDYSVTGDSSWVGARNFAEVLFDGEFWYSLRVSLVYSLLFLFFGFWVPIALAFLLSEIPKGGTFFRIVYYLPAILSGVVVIFLWKSFYGPDGLINQVLNGGVYLLNCLRSTPMETFHGDWLQDKTWAMFFCLLPTIWAGMGPGCLIYLAALKTVPEDIYEAADLDGAGIFGKIFHVAVPSIRALITINFIGAMIGAIRGAGGFMLAMTGGGPYGESGGATEVIGLKLFYTTFGYLKFGTGAAMAWVLGAMLIGFTVIQLQRLSKLEFRTTEKVA